MQLNSLLLNLTTKKTVTTLVTVYTSESQKAISPPKEDQVPLFQPTTNRAQRLLAGYAEVRRRKAEGQREVWRDCKYECS